MKAIMIMYDSLNRHMLPPYGCDWVIAPNFSRLAKKTVTFDNCYIGSMPCMPARREIHTGRYNFLHRSWGPLEPFDDSMPEILQANGVYTHLVSDHYHYWEDGGATYHQRYNTWENVRGQEGDKWKGQVAKVDLPKHLGQCKHQDMLNRSFMEDESLQPQAQTFSKGLEFIENNKNDDNWFLQIETFDPHEPYYSCQKYKDLYDPDYNGPVYDWPEYRKVTDDEREYIEHVRHENAALISMCDHHLGRVLDIMDANNMWDDTMLIINTDHGFLLGEHDWWAKKAPYYEEVAHTPLFIWDPRYEVKDVHRQSLIQTIDLAPTLLDFFDAPQPKDMLGKPATSIICEDNPIHEAVLFGMHGGEINITDGRYVYMRQSNACNWPLYEYTLMPTHMRGFFELSELSTTNMASPFSFTKDCPVMKIEARQAVKKKPAHETLLYDMQNDPHQQNPIHDEGIEAYLSNLMVTIMKENDAPIEQYERMELLNLLDK